MATAKVTPPLVKRGSTSLVNQAVLANSTYTLSIALGRSDFNIGFAVVTIPNSLAFPLLRRTNAHLWFTDVLADAVAQSTLRVSVPFTSYQLIDYTIADNRHAGYFYSVDGFLSEAQFNNDEFTSAIRILSAQINGSNLEIVFKNINVVGTANVTVDVSWLVRSAKVVT